MWKAQEGGEADTVPEGWGHGPWGGAAGLGGRRQAIPELEVLPADDWHIPKTWTGMVEQSCVALFSVPPAVGRLDESLPGEVGQRGPCKAPRSRRDSRQEGCGLQSAKESGSTGLRAAVLRLQSLYLQYLFKKQVPRPQPSRF